MITLSFDAIIIGTGQAGPSLAARLAAEGKQVAILEKALLGGASYRVVTESMPIHPTVSELLPTVLQSLRPLA